ncbi:MAG: MFS transporter, partial [Burkholderiales bacterium]|nr:MFS transporter [Burkholderiales bacterium]
LNDGFTINVAVFLFILPFLLFSSTAGKLADCNDKAKLTQYIKLFEIFLNLLILFALYYKLTWLLLLNIFFVGVYATFLGPIKYAIIPQYLDKEQIVDGTGYVEFITFIAIIVGQICGTWFIIHNHIMFAGFVLLGFSLLGYVSSLKMQSVPSVTDKLAISLNIFKDTYNTYLKIMKTPKIKTIIHFTSWFWALAAIITTQLPLFCQKYINSDANFYLVILVSFSISIGLGSVICAKMSKQRSNPNLGLLGIICISIFGFLLLFINNKPTIASIYSIQFIIVIAVCLMLGIACGFFSITCYNQMQLASPNDCRSQIVSILNIVNSFYMIIASLIAAILLLFINVWQVLVILFTINCVIAWIYAHHHKII